MRDIDLGAYQPAYYKKSELTRCLNAALEAEMRRLFAYADDMAAEARVETSVNWLGVWERSVGLPADTDLTIEQRRSRVLAKLRQMDTTTVERIKIIASSYARGEVEVIEDYTKYTVIINFVSVIGKPDNMDGLIEQLRRIMPAHLAVNYVYKYRTWGEVLNTGKTWRELYEAGRTWKDIMEKEAL